MTCRSETGENTLAGVHPRTLGEPFHAHGLGEQKSLDQVEAHLPHGMKVSPGLDTFGDRARAVSICKLENAAAHRLLQTIGGAAGDEFSVDFDLDEGELSQSGKRAPFGAEVVDRDCDLVGAELFGKIPDEFQVA